MKNKSSQNTDWEEKIIEILENADLELEIEPTRNSLFLLIQSEKDISYEQGREDMKREILEEAKRPNQTNNWEKEVDELHLCCGGDFCDDSMHPDNKEEIKKIISRELTNLLKTVAEAMGEEKKVSYTPGDGWNDCRSQIISNISEKYPEFSNYLKK